MGCCTRTNPGSRFSAQVQTRLCVQVCPFPTSPSFHPTDASAYDSQTFMAELDKKAASCNYAGYVRKHVTYPPKGLLPLPGKSTSADKGCDVWDDILNAALIVNPAFNIYRIFDTVSAHYVLI
jgi:hypothetical protein